MIAFTAGDLSRADGVGIIFSQGLPRSSDIQKIISVSLGCTRSAAQGFMAMAGHWMCLSASAELNCFLWLLVELFKSRVSHVAGVTHVTRDKSVYFENPVICMCFSGPARPPYGLVLLHH